MGKGRIRWICVLGAGNEAQNIYLGTDSWIRCSVQLPKRPLLPKCCLDIYVINQPLPPMRSGKRPFCSASFFSSKLLLLILFYRPRFRYADLTFFPMTSLYLYRPRFLLIEVVFLPSTTRSDWSEAVWSIGVNHCCWCVIITASRRSSLIVKDLSRPVSAAPGLVNETLLGYPT
jgi:hypothetical protein